MLNNEKPLVIFDTSVVMHCVFTFFKDKKAYFPWSNKQRDQRIKDTIRIYNTLFFLGNVDQRDFDILWVGDSDQDDQPYWRREYWMNWWGSLDETSQDKLIKPGTVKRKGYKGNRTSTPDSQWCKRQFNKYSNALMVDGYEADDIAASVIKLNPNRRIILMTIDSDWLQLVNDNVTWICLKGYPPQFRNEEKGMDWFKYKLSIGTKKEQKLLERKELDLRFIPHWKHLVGDNSDNLCAKSPIELIDLYNPPEEYQLWVNQSFTSKIRYFIKEEDREFEKYLDVMGGLIDFIEIPTPTIKPQQLII
jgi:hypothetical protein